jgi:hypothetical protein
MFPAGLTALFGMVSLSYAVVCVIRGVTHGRYWRPIYRETQPLGFWWNILLFGLIVPAFAAYAFVQILNR